MRLCNFYTADDVMHLGVVDGDRVLDLTAAGGGRKELASVTAWLRGRNPARQEAERLLGEWRSGERTGLALATLRHAPLVTRDSRIFCVGLNYADHAAEAGLPLPATALRRQPGARAKQWSPWRRGKLREANGKNGDWHRWR